MKNAKKFFCITKVLLLSLLSLHIISCTSETDTENKIAQIVEGRSAQDLLSDLFIGSKGDTEAVGRMLKSTPSSLERIRMGTTTATPEFAERIKEVSRYYVKNDQSFTKLRAALDEEWKWYDSVLHWPTLSPISFWAVNIILVLLLAFLDLHFIWPLLIEIILFLLVWILSSVSSPKPIEDRYVDSINPVIEQIK